jgi:hypothetical protein
MLARMTSNLRPLALAVTLLSTLVAPAPVSAEITATHVFVSVESYNILGDSDVSGADVVEVTGVIQGESAPRSVRFYYSPKYPGSSSTGTDSISSKRSFERCERLALLAMSKPGQYLLEMRQEREGIQPITYYVGCKLTRRVP